MAITRFNPNTGLTAATGTAAEQAAVALTRLRGRNIVNKFNGASVTENLPTGITAARHIEITSNINVNTAGYYVFVNRTVEFANGASIRASVDGVHIAFFNCNLIFRGQNANAGNQSQLCIVNTTGNLHTGGHDVSITQAQASSRSINFYGCSYQIDEDATGGFYWLQGDCFDTSFILNDDNVFLPSTFIGARLINVSFFSRRGALDVLELYGIPAILEGIVLDGLTWEFVTTVNTIDLLLTNPRYTDNAAFQGTQEQRFRLNTTNSDATFKSIGFQSTVDNTLAKAFATGNTANAYVRGSGNASGGAYLLYGWRPEFYEDGGDTGIGGVRVRVANGLTMNSGTTSTSNFRTDQASTAGYTLQDNALTSRGATIDQTGNTKNVVHEYISVAGTPTDAFRGKLRLQDGLVRVSIDGGATWHQDQHINWGRLRNEDTTTTAVDAFYTNFNNQTSAGAGDNVIASPLVYIGQNNFNQYEASYEARSYTHQINVAEELQNGRVSADGDGATQVADTLVPIASRTVLGAQPRPNIVTATEAAALARFNAENDKTIQNINDFLIAAWASYHERGDLNLITQQGSNAVINYDITFTALGSATPLDNISITGNDLTITNVNDIAAPLATDPINGFTTTGDVTFSNIVGSLGTNIGCNNLTLSTNETYSGTFTVGGNLSAARATFATGTVANVTGNLTAANTTWQDGVNITVTGTTGIAGATIGTDSTTAAVTTLTGTGAITGDASTTIGDNTMLSGTFSSIRLGQFNGTTLAAGSTLDVTDTGTIVLDSVTISGTGNITINKGGSGTLTVQVPSTQLSRWTEGTGSITIEALPSAPVTRGFINEVFTSSAGTTAGWFTLFHRPTAGTGTWTEHSDGEQVIGNGATHTFTVRSTDSNANSEWLALWRPADRTASTTAQLFDYTTSFPANAGNETIRRTPIAAALLASTLAANAGDIPSGVAVAWSTSNTGVPRTELFGNITGTDSTGTPLSGAQSQTLMLTAYESKSYFDLYKMHIDTLTGDYILPTSQITTSGDGQFVQLDSGDGAQQNLTAVDDFDADGDTMTGVLTATIMGREGSGATATGREIEFAAVQIVANPAGATTAQIQGAVGNALGTLPTRAQLRQDMSNAAGTGVTFNSDGTAITPNTRPAD